MRTSVQTPRETTVAFLPHRLNRQPVIVRGLTASELWITVGVSAAAGLALGIVLSIVTGSIAATPATTVACIAAGVFFGGGLLRRHKRGRPETWLYRKVQWELARRVPGLATRVGGGDLILRSGYWSTRRRRR